MNLDEFFRDVYRIHHPALRSKNSLEQYASVIRVAERYHQQKHGTAAKLTTADLSETLLLGCAASLVDHPKAPRSPATANRILRTLAALWREAHKRGHAPPLPCEIPRYPEPRRNPIAWSPAEFSRVLEATADEPGFIGPVPASSWLLALQLFVFWTGCRISAAMSTETASLDPVALTVKIDADHQKHRADGLYDLPADLVDLLLSFGAHDRGLATLFGDWPHDRSQPSWRALNARLTRILSRAGLPSGRRDKWHKIRRTHATQIAARRGVATAQKMLGHSDIRVTERYIDPQQMPREKATEILEAPTVSARPKFRIVG